MCNLSCSECSVPAVQSHNGSTAGRGGLVADCLQRVPRAAVLPKGGRLCTMCSVPRRDPGNQHRQCMVCKRLLGLPWLGRGRNTCLPATQVPRYGHLVCGGCSIMLMYPVSASCVKCSVCHFVTPVGSASAAAAAAGGAGSSRASDKPTQTVVIENPPSLDEHGNEVGVGQDVEDVVTRCSWLRVWDH